MNVAYTNAHTAARNPKTTLGKGLFYLPMTFHLPLQPPFLCPALVPNGETISPMQGAKTPAPHPGKTACGGTGYARRGTENIHRPHRIPGRCLNKRQMFAILFYFVLDRSHHKNVPLCIAVSI
jgi:hypothetical protein